MRQQFLLAIDLGTTNCKAILVDEHAAVVRRSTSECVLATPKPGWAEQNPRHWWQAVCQSVRTVTANIDSAAIRAVGVCGQMHGLVLLDGQSEVLRPAILWNDQRSVEYCSAIHTIMGGSERVVALAGNPILPGYVAGKLLWLSAHEPDVLERARTMLLPKDYVRFRLCGDVATDPSDASGTGLFDVRSRRWCSTLIDKLEIPTGLLPDCRPASAIAGNVPRHTAEELGLPPGVPVITGGGDAVMQTVGASAIDPAAVLVVIGTGGNVTVSMNRPISNPEGRLQLFCHTLPDMWALMGVSLTAGSSLRWFRDVFARAERTVAADLGVDAYDLLCREAQSSPPGANRLLFLPYLQGERCPHVDAQARGTWLGLSLSTSRADVIRSIMEGVGFSLFDILRLIAGAGVPIGSVIVSGGGSASALWRQILADIMEREVRTMQHGEDAGALGAALLAGVQAGIWSSPSEAVSLIKVASTEQPLPQNVGLYRELYEVYRRQYAVLKPTYQDLSSHGLPGQGP